MYHEESSLSLARFLHMHHLCTLLAPSLKVAVKDGFLIADVKDWFSIADVAGCTQARSRAWRRSCCCAHPR